MLQFTTGPKYDFSADDIIAEENEPPTLHVSEEEGQLTLIVERAAGWYGQVTSEWRTHDGTAVSHQLPKDFEVSSCSLHVFDRSSL